jgi:hypothetical protein
MLAGAGRGRNSAARQEGCLRGALPKARAQMLVDDLLCAVLAGSATTADRQFCLNLVKGARTAVDSISDLPIGDRVTNADVHNGVSPLETMILTLILSK